MLSAKIGYFRATAHPEALAWQTRVIANGGTVSASTLAAVSNFCNAIQTAGIRDRFYRLNLFAGTGLSAALVPLYRGQSLGGTQFGGATDTNSNFVSGDYVETGSTGGLTGNGSTKYLSTGFVPNSLSLGNTHLSAYANGANSNTSFACALGSFAAQGAGELALYFNQSGLSTAAYFATDNGSGFVASSVNNPTGHLLGSSNATNDRRFFRNGTQSGSTSTTNSSIALPSASDRDIFIFRRSSGGSAPSYTNARLASYSIGASMNASQASAFYTAMQAFQAALSRSV